MNPAAPKSIFRAILICAASLCFAAFAPSAFAQKGGSRGGGGSHGGGSHASGGSHAGISHGGGGFHGGSVHSGGPYGGFGVPAHSGGGSVSSTASSSSSSHGSGTAGSVRRMNFTSNTFVAPPAAAVRPVEGAARTIFINAHPEFTNTSAPTGARPFAAGNYLWEAPPQQAQQRAATPPPAAAPAPRPITAPAPQPIQPTVMQPPSPIRPMSIPSPSPMQIPGSLRTPGQMPIARPGAIPGSPMPMPISRPISPVMSRPIASPVRPTLRPMLGGQFVAPPLRVPGIVTPALRRILAGPVPPMSHPPLLPVRPPFAGMAVEPGARRRPITSFTAFGSSNATPAHPCINTIARCGFGGGVLDGDGDFDNDGFGFGSSIFFGFLGPFGFSPLGFGSTCIFDGFFQNCFLSPVNFPPFGFGAFGLCGSWYSSYNCAPYGSSFLFMPPVENLQPAFGDYLPNTNYAPSYSFEPEPLPVPEEAPPSANASEAIQPVVNLVLKDGTVFGVTSYWLVDDRLFYITTYKIQSSIPMDQLDLQKTVDMNWKRGIAFTLTPQPPDQQPQQNPPPR